MAEAMGKGGRQYEAAWTNAPARIAAEEASEEEQCHQVSRKQHRDSALRVCSKATLRHAPREGSVQQMRRKRDRSSQRIEENCDC
jgi:hypothetical protein